MNKCRLTFSLELTIIFA